VDSSGGRPEHSSGGRPLEFERLGEGDPRLAPTDSLSVARTQLERYQAPDGMQAAVQRQMLDFVDRHPDALLRSCVEGHLTGSALVVDADGERLLMLFHRKAQRWLQPGGHADGDANLAGVARREAQEETGIDGLVVITPPVDLDVHRVAFPNEVPHLHLDCRFVVVAPVGAMVRGNHESESLRWVTVDELADLDADPGTVRMARRGLTWLRSA
jgi:8-oxo-dGTP pyrophosphatase MutT (NUDIX family)